MNKNSRIRSATEEDVLRAFGPEGFVFGIPVRPRPEPEEQRVDDAEERVDDAYGKQQPELEA